MVVGADLAWLIGVVQGDGHVNKYFVEISDRYKENLEVVASVISKLGFKTVISKDSRESRFRLWINSKDFAALLRNYGADRKDRVPRIKPELYTHYISGIYDAEGYIEYWKLRGLLRINLAYKYEEVVDFIANVLRDHGIKPYVRFSSRVYRIQIYRKGDVRTFIEHIGFRYPSKKIRVNSLLSP